MYEINSIIAPKERKLDSKHWKFGKIFNFFRAKNEQFQHILEEWRETLQFLHSMEGELEIG
jgi:hypothetical protein